MGMEDDGDSYGSAHNRYDLADSDKLSVELDDVIDDDSDGAIDLNDIKSQDDKDASDSKEGPEEETKQEGSDSGNSAGKEQSTNSSGGASVENMFAVGQSKDKGLADMETGSEVYMSELLVSLTCGLTFNRPALTWKTSMMLKKQMKRICSIWGTNSPK